MAKSNSHQNGWWGVLRASIFSLAVAVLANFEGTQAFAQQSDVTTPDTPYEHFEEQDLSILLEKLALTSDIEEARFLDQKIKEQWEVIAGDTGALFMNWAYQSLDENNIEQAIEILDRTLKLYPDFFSARMLRAECFWSMEIISNALSDLEIVLALEPRHYEAFALMAEIFIELNRPELAKIALDKVEELYPTYESLEFLRQAIAEETNQPRT